ncbi:type VI secretion system protein TssL, long form [Limnobacter humi]|uniref:Type VI secretion system protein TssL, long form n=1 Tax=Limnobacter humi TaxID=1778671 RepID=A0ABT1WD68_9BURK|nr:type VI secretion system protein TssL, long form [Limnobacter humi]MCQ8895465.1 type VI secretion system protein TssL, long form [Limnobacter humi]
MTDDPLFSLGGERTVIKPRLARAANTAKQPATDALDNLLGCSMEARPGSTAANTDPDWAYALRRFAGGAPSFTNNVLLQHSIGLLRLGHSIQTQAALTRPDLLADTCMAGLKALDSHLQRLNRPQAERVSVRYLLCSMLDEFAANTPWGGSGLWAKHSLLLHFFQETWGGEKCFSLLQRFMQTPAEHRDLLELMLWILASGFKGKYHVEAQGDWAIAQLLGQVYRLLGQTRNPNQVFNNTAWTSKAPALKQGLKILPISLPVGAALLVMAMLFAVLRGLLNIESDATQQAFDRLTWPETARSSTAAPLSMTAQFPEQLSLVRQLQDDIVNGYLTLREQGSRSTVILTSDHLFDSGRADIHPAAIPLLVRVAQAMATHPGHITITGYTDDQPIRSLRYPSNWQLSEDRARHVRALVAPHLPNVEMVSEGAGSANPLVSNATPEGRAKNRRVEITLNHKP